LAVCEEKRKKAKKTIRSAVLSASWERGKDNNGGPCCSEPRSAIDSDGLIFEKGKKRGIIKPFENFYSSHAVETRGKKKRKEKRGANAGFAAEEGGKKGHLWLEGKKGTAVSAAGDRQPWKTG